MAAGGHATLAFLRFRTPSPAASALAHKSMCVTGATMNLLYPSCRFHSCLPDEQAAERRTTAPGFTCAGEASPSEVGL